MDAIYTLYGITFDGRSPAINCIYVVPPSEDDEFAEYIAEFQADNPRTEVTRMALVDSKCLKQLYEHLQNLLVMEEL